LVALQKEAWLQKLVRQPAEDGLAGAIDKGGTLMFKLDDKVWCASLESVERQLTCPECLGDRAWTVIMGDGSQVSIECSLCKVGYAKPYGYITYRAYEPKVKQRTITRIEQSRDGYEYTVDECSIVKAVFENMVDAFQEACRMVDEYDEAERKRIEQKEKGNKNWAWHVRYHRQCIREAEKSITYHTAKLNIAKAKLGVEDA